MRTQIEHLKHRLKQWENEADSNQHNMAECAERICEIIQADIDRLEASNAES